MATLEFCDVVLVRVPYTDQSETKLRPAVVVSSTCYQRSRADVILMAITSRTDGPLRFGDVELAEWDAAGLRKPSRVKPVIATLQRDLVRRRLGHLGPEDRAAVRDSLSGILG
ncbi:MAG: type II toxin-antitoxin system PemK/MazF family toxin [Gammaproteobacteria bacterium]|nr:type II toxin-antitoxin system PemK/MazF family toxin [Gammaproteobacteria bacterium]